MKRRCAAITLSLLALCLCRVVVADTAAPPDLPVTVSWVGNTWSGAKDTRGQRMFFPTLIDGFAAAGNGRWAIMSNYNEGGSNVTSCQGENWLGAVGPAIPIHTSGQIAIDPDAGNLFVSNQQGGVAAVLPNGADWYPEGKDASASYRNPANWPDGIFAHSRFCAGISVRNHLLFVSDATSAEQIQKNGDGNSFNGILVFDARTLKLIRKFPVVSPGRLAACHDGSLWVIHGTKATRFSALGKPLATADITRVQGPMGICVDARDRLLITDRSIASDIKIYATNGSFAGTFGQSIFSGPKAKQGWVGPARLDRPIGVGTDDSGNLYIASAGEVFPQAGRVECYATQGNTWGKMLWRVSGHMFGDACTFDPQNEDLLYNSCGVFRMDWSKPGGGQEWQYLGSTLDFGEYPQEPRYNINAQGYAARSTYGLRYLFGQKFLYTADANNLGIFRFDPEHIGTVARPVGYIAMRSTTIDYAVAGWPPFQPAPPWGWVWADKNGNGRFEATEFSRAPEGWPGGHLWSSLDPQGNLWFLSTELPGQIIELPIGDKPDEAGNPVYDIAACRKLPYPGEYQKVGMTFLSPDGDLMIVGKRTDGTDAEKDGDRDYSLSFYPRWTANPSVAPAWTKRHMGGVMRYQFPIPGENDIGSVTTAGEYVFVASAIQNSVRVYKRSDGSFVGRMHSPLSDDTTLDDAHAFQVHLRKNGEYDLLLEDFFHNKNLMYRWIPPSVRPTP